MATAANAMERRLLLAEDSAVAILYKAYLQKAGWTVLTAGDGLSAVEIALNEPVALVLMDLGLPELRGVEAARRIREAGKRMPIIALTAEDDASDGRACREAGMNGFLQKPIGPAALRDEVERIATDYAAKLRAAKARSAAMRAAMARATQPADPAPNSDQHKTEQPKADRPKRPRAPARSRRVRAASPET